MTHEELRELASAYVLDALDRDDLDRFEAHLAGCVECQAEVRSFQPVADALARTADSKQPSAAVRARVLDAPRRSSTARPVPVPWFLAAAALLALAVLTPYTVQLRNRTRALMVAVRDLTARLADTDRQLVAVRGEVSLLTAPDVKRVDLRGQSVAPQAGARAFWSRSRGVYFVASNLPPLPAWKEYQLWFVTTPGPVSVSVFRPDQRGDAALIGTVRAGMGEPNAMAVTLEPAGGLPAPTGAFYLVGPAN